MDLSSVRKDIRFSGISLLNPALVLFIIWGLVTRFFISLNLPLDSDAVGMGLMAMEIGKHHNYLLSGYNLLTTDSLVLTELVPFQLLPQILTNYSPVALKSVVFLLFVLSVAAFMYLVWFISADTRSALLFGALAANIPPGGYFWLAYPTSHNATILFGAVIVIILVSLQRTTARKVNTAKTRKRTPDETPTLPWTYSLALVVLVFLSVFSDTIILVWVLVPYCIAYLLFFRKENQGMDPIVTYIAITSVVAYLLKTYVIPGWLKTDYTVNSIPVIVSTNIPLFFKAVFLFLNQGIYTLMSGTAGVGPAEILSGLFFIGVIFCCIRSWWNGRQDYPPQKQMFAAVLLTSVVLTAAACLVSGFFVDIAGARYLTFTALALLMLVAISCPVTEKTCAFFVLSLLCISAITGSMYLVTITPHPNEREYGLITYLEEQNRTFGYGSYWDANVITYLSGEAVTIRSVFFRHNTLQRDRLNSCDRWWSGQPEGYFIVYNATEPMDEAKKNLIRTAEYGNTSRILHYRDYEIFPMNNS